MVLEKQQILISRPTDEALASAFVPTAAKVDSSLSFWHPNRIQQQTLVRSVSCPLDVYYMWHVIHPHTDRQVIPS